MANPHSIGVIGGNGQLGGAMIRGLLKSGFFDPSQIYVANRSGNKAGFEDWGDLTVTTDIEELLDKCDIVVLCVPPAAFRALKLDATGKLVISVMAGISLADIGKTTQATRIVRAMSSPAAEMMLAYSPWCESAGTLPGDLDFVRRVFSAIGQTDQVPSEDQIDLFTALTGPVPGFVAFFADCMVSYATKQGIEPETAQRAVRQLFLASGNTMALSDRAPEDFVREMVDYAGTTAAGLTAMIDADLSSSVAKGLDAAYEKAKSIGLD